MIGKNIMMTILIGGLHQRKTSKECRQKILGVLVTEQRPWVPYDLPF
jgi:hypothetical protein